MKDGPVTPREITRWKQKLTALRTEIVGGGDVPIDQTGADEDAQPLTEMSQVIASTRNSERTAVLARVVGALKRLEETPEDFGLCAECGDPIGRRLEAMPYVECCVECQQERDGSPRRGRRRHLTDFR